jgi:transcriptional regulator with PAS, ATPase and Fis domain
VVCKTGDLIGGAWVEVLDQLGEAVIVLDHQRTLQHVNDAARRLLGYEHGQQVGGRCKLTTRGVDCENACPLTFALETGLERVEDFATVYHTIDGRALALRITVIPLTDEGGGFRGAVEILRPTDPKLGFYLAGCSAATDALRKRVAALARGQADVCLVGEPPTCRDVARAMHRFSGMPDNLFRTWDGSWDGISPWPPGTMYASGDGVGSLFDGTRPEGWRIVIGGSDISEVESLEVLELPSVEELEEDLSKMIVAWIEDLSPRTRVSPAALERLARVVRDRGFEEMESVLTAALALGGDCVEEEHLPVDGYHTAFVDELLKAPKPLAALEERLLREVLERCGWRMQEAAERVGISRVTLWRKMKDLGIEKNS